MGSIESIELPLESGRKSCPPPNPRCQRVSLKKDTPKCAKFHTTKLGIQSKVYIVKNRSTMRLHPHLVTAFSEDVCYQKNIFRLESWKNPKDMSFSPSRSPGFTEPQNEHRTWIPNNKNTKRRFSEVVNPPMIIH